MKALKHLDPALVGLHNADLQESCRRLSKSSSYRDLSTVCVVVNRGMIPSKAVQSWMSMATPMNQKHLRLFVEKQEVGEGYNMAIDAILANSELRTWKFVLTIEEDNIVPPDGLLKLYENMDKFDAVSGLYWTKGEGGMPMIYGDVRVMPKNFVPQLPVPDSLQPCNGIGMGFALFKMDMFHKIPRPWFKTMQEFVPGQGLRACTQDLYFCQEAAKFGYRFAVDTRIRVGHLDPSTGTVW